MKHKIRCGAGIAKITPPESLLPNLFGLMLTAYSEVHDDLFVRIVAFDNGESKALIVSFDLDKGPHPDQYTEQLAQVTGVPQDAILYFGIHTHTAPITGYRPFEPRNDITKKPSEVQRVVHSYEQLVLERLLEAARQAMDNLRPARLGCGWGDSYINVNRCQEYIYQREDGTTGTIMGNGVNGNTPAGHRLFVMKAEDEKGNPIAFFVNYPVHCVAMFLNNAGNGTSCISGDIGGNVSQYIEAAHPGSVAIWSSGAAGDINSVMMTQTFYPDPVTGKPVEHRLNSLDASCTILNTLAGRHYADIQQVIRRIHAQTDTASIAAKIEWVKTPSCKGILEKEEWLPDEEGTYDIRLHLLQIGETALIGVNGELYSSLGRDICNASPLENTVVINHEASLLLNNPGYILDSETIYRCQKADEASIPGAAAFCGVPDIISQELLLHTKSMFSKLP